MIPKDQFPQTSDIDYFVGVKLDKENGESTIYGFIERSKIETLHPINDFNEGDCYWAYLSELTPIEELKEKKSSGNLKEWL